jgi:phage/plasmid primase-like uncharacterized protein
MAQEKNLMAQMSVIVGKSRFRIYDDDGKWAIKLPPNGDGLQRVVVVDKQTGELIGGAVPSTPYTALPKPHALTNKQWYEMAPTVAPKLLTEVDVDSPAF